MTINYYELIEEDTHCDGEYETSFGRFSTYEKAEELMKNFKGLDGFGVCEDELKIVERTFKLDDVVEDWVIELIENGRKRKKEYIKKYGPIED